MIKDIVITSCYECGIDIFIRDEHNTQLKDARKTFYCLNGHAQHYVTDSRQDLIERLKTKNNLIQQKEDAIRGLEMKVEKLSKTKKRKRVTK